VVLFQQDEEVGMIYELSHVQEAMQQLEKHSADPFSLPPASEQVCYINLIELGVKISFRSYLLGFMLHEVI
jgi:hypothetical protein